ncbi:hypothetical protein H0W80_01995 [Candidatus Saccharibacteria bacterium]|nr:hypothetical protein [Candidatus Saccharibacteria bacterium]
MTISLKEQPTRVALTQIDIVKTTASQPGTRKPTTVLVFHVPICQKTKNCFRAGTTESFLDLLGAISKVVRISNSLVAVWPNPELELDDELEEAIVRQIVNLRNLSEGRYQLNRRRNHSKIAREIIAQLNFRLKELRSIELSKRKVN